MRNPPLTVTSLVQALERRELSAEELTGEVLARLDRTEPVVGAFLTVDAEGALAAARRSDCRRAHGETLHPMDGIPFAVKDNFCTAGVRTTCASRMLEHYIPPYSATVVSRLQSAGCVLMGKLNMDEFAMGSSTQHSALGITRNPLNPECVPGGSSGGSAAAVAAGELPFAIGSDTGGSIRQPAAFCGVMGFKPTYGLLSRYGLISFAPSLDCVGIITGTVADAAQVLQLTAGRDPLDATCLSAGIPDFAETVGAGVKGLRIAVVPDAGMGSTSAFLSRAVLYATECLRDAGATAEEAVLPSPEQALLSYCTVSAVEAASNLARFDGIRFGTAQACEESPETRISAARGAGFGEEVKRRILLGTALLTGSFRERYYLPACRLRRGIVQAMASLLERYDLLLMPTAPGGAFRADQPLSAMDMRKMDLCTVYASLAGIPAMSVPVGEDESGMPLGIQIMASRLHEDLILRAAQVLENGKPD